MTSDWNFQVPEGHHPRGTALREALQGHLPLRAGRERLGCFSVPDRGLCRDLFEGSAGSPRGYAGLGGGPQDFPRVVTLSF